MYYFYKVKTLLKTIEKFLHENKTMNLKEYKKMKKKNDKKWQE